MKIQLIKAWNDGNKTYPPLAVLQLADGDAHTLIAEGYGHKVPDDTRLFVGKELITTCVASPTAGALSTGAGPFDATGEEIDLDELTAQKPQAVPKTARFKL